MGQRGGLSTKDKAMLTNAFCRTKTLIISSRITIVIIINRVADATAIDATDDEGAANDGAANDARDDGGASRGPQVHSVAGRWLALRQLWEPRVQGRLQCNA